MGATNGNKSATAVKQSCSSNLDREEEWLIVVTQFTGQIMCSHGRRGGYTWRWKASMGWGTGKFPSMTNSLCTIVGYDVDAAGFCVSGVL